mgnify:CR=1 FL=1
MIGVSMRALTVFSTFHELVRKQLYNEISGVLSNISPKRRTAPSFAMNAATGKLAEPKTGRAGPSYRVVRRNQ